jgi:hypothetical protein
MQQGAEERERAGSSVRGVRRAVGCEGRMLGSYMERRGRSRTSDAEIPGSAPGCAHTKRMTGALPTYPSQH